MSAELSEDSVPPDSVVAELRRILQQISGKADLTRNIDATVLISKFSKPRQVEGSKALGT